MYWFVENGLESVVIKGRVHHLLTTAKWSLMHALKNGL